MYRSSANVHATVFGGLPVQLQVYIAPPDPSVGIFQSSVDDFACYWPSGHEWSQRMYDRLSEDEKERLFEQVWDALSDHDC